MIIKPATDAMGHALADYLVKGKSHKLLIDSDISETDEIPVPYLFRNYNDMPPIEQTALSICNGKILDVGAAAGSHSLWLQNQGHMVTAMDISEMACGVMKQRGVSEVLNIDFFETKLSQKFDTLLFLMNGIGICGTLDKLPAFFNQCKQMLAPGGQILVDSSDLIYMYGDEDDGYTIDLNGSYYGEVVYVMRYGKVKTEPFNWLFVDANTLEGFAIQEGFSYETLIEGNHFDYLARLQIKK